jgi:hypothetical protein
MPSRRYSYGCSPAGTGEEEGRELWEPLAWAMWEARRPQARTDNAAAVRRIGSSFFQSKYKYGVG